MLTCGAGPRPAAASQAAFDAGSRRQGGAGSLPHKALPLQLAGISMREGLPVLPNLSVKFQPQFAAHRRGRFSQRV